MPLLTLPQPTVAQSEFPVTPGVLSVPVAVEFSPTTEPGETPVWVDVTDRVRSTQIKRGRQRVLDRYETGTATLVLDNSDRQFDPAYTSGDYFGNLLPMRRWRIRVQRPAINAYDEPFFVEHHRFSGFAESYRQQYDRSDNLATCVVQLADAFKVLALARPTSPWSAYVQSQGSRVAGWYRLSETEAGSGLRDSSSNAHDGSYAGSPTFAQTGLVASDPNTCASFSGGSYAYADTIAVTDFLMLEGWFSTSASAAQTVVAYGDSGGRLLLSVELDASGHVLFKWGNAPFAITLIQTSTSTYNDSAAHHFAVPIVKVGSAWVPGQAAIDGSTAFASAFTSGALPAVTPNRLVLGSNFGSSQNFTGKIDEVVAYSVASTDTASMYAGHAAGAAPFEGDDSGTRVGRVLDAIGWPEEDRDIDTGNSTLQAADYGDGSALDHLQAVALTEQGQFYTATDGKITFLARRSTSVSGGFADTLTDDPVSGARFSDVGFSYDDTLIRNAVVAQRVGGGEVTVNDPASVAAYYERTYTQSGLLYEDDNQTRDFAQWIVNRFKDPALRVETMTVLPEANPDDLYPVILDLELGSPVMVERTPLGLGNTISQRVVVEGYTETITPEVYSFVASISEADLSTYWILGDSTFSVLGSTTRLAF